MKKGLIILIVCFSSYTAGAQSNTSFGLRITPMFNWVSPSDTGSLYSYSNSSAKMGIGFGPSMRYSFSDNFNIDISGIFTWQEFAIDQTDDVGNTERVDVTENFKLQYLNIPLNLNGQFNVLGELKAIINFGAGFNVKLKSVRQLKDNLGVSSFQEDYINVKMLNFMDIYLSAGLGLGYSFQENLHLSLTGQYNNGILDGWFDNKNDLPSTIDELTLKHRNITLNIGFYIDF